MRKLAAAATVALSASALLLSALPALATPPTTNLETIRVAADKPRSMVFARGNLFIADTNTVIVIDTAGRTLTKLPNLAGVRSLAVSPSGDRVYAALAGAAEIAVLDTVSLTKVGSFPTAPCPTDVAPIGDRLFYSTGCNLGEGAISSVEASTGFDAQATSVTGLSAAPLLAGTQNTLLAGITGTSPTDVVSYRVGGTTLTQQGVAAGAFNSLRDLTLAPDASTAFVASGSPYKIQSFDATTMVPQQAYETGPYPTAVAVNHHGDRVAAGLLTATEANLVVFNRTDVSVEVAGSAYPAAKSSQPQVAPGTLVFSDDDQHVYALVGDSAPGYYLTSADVTYTKKSPALTLSVTQPNAMTKTATVTAKLADRQDPDVTFTIQDLKGTVEKLTVNAGSTGRAELSRAFPAGTTVTADYVGSDAYDQAMTAAVTVRGFTALTLSKVASPASASKKLTAQATLTGAPAGSSVAFSVDTPGEDAAPVVVKVDAKGIAKLSTKLSNGGVLTARYAGTSTYQAAVSPEARVTVASKTTVTLRGEYKTKKKVAYFHQAKDVKLTIKVTPASASVVAATLQVKDSKKWKTVNTGPLVLTKGSATATPTELAKRKVYRVVATFTQDTTARSSSATSREFTIRS